MINCENKSLHVAKMVYDSRMSNTTTNQMTRGTEVRSSEWFGVRYYVGTAPYGRDFIVPQETYEETCKWFDGMEKQNWNAW